ncbi:MAG TPA: hypothetical protein VG389_17700 [Myxococcota bacterium]|jgi:hypothetical protein|nr:hypothetical protein [Myxococcota bacterium]
MATEGLGALCGEHVSYMMMRFMDGAGTTWVRIAPLCLTAAAMAAGGGGCVPGSRAGERGVDGDAPPMVVPVSGGGMAAAAGAVVPESDVPVAVAVPLADGAALPGNAAIDFLRLGDERGARTAVVRANGALDLVDAAGAVTRALDENVVPGLSASAGGTRLAWARRRGGPETDIVVADVGDGRERGSGGSGGGAAAASAPFAVTDWEGAEDGPALSPDGARVAFVSGRTSVASIWVAPARAGGGAAAVQVTNAGVTRAARAPGLPPSGFVPPPDAGTLRWEDPATLAWEAHGRTFRVVAR